MNHLNQKQSLVSSYINGISIQCLPIFFFLGLLSPVDTNAQSVNIDSLEQLLGGKINDRERAEVLLSLGKRYEVINLEVGKNYLDQVLDLAQQWGDEALEIKINKLLIEEYITIIDLDSAIIIAKKSLAYYKKLADEKNIAFIYSRLGIIHRMKGELAIARNYLNEGLPFAKDKPILLLQLYVALTGVEITVGAYEKAIINAFKALEIAEKEQHKQGISRINNMIGQIYFNQGAPEKAFPYIEKAAKLHDTTNISRNLIVDYKDLGTAYAELDQVHKAIDCFRRTLSFATKLGDKTGALFTKLSLLNVLVTKNLFPEEVEVLLTELDTVNFHNMMGEYETIKVEYHKNKREYKIALATAQEALRIIEEYPNLIIQVALIKLMYEIYHLQNDYQLAFEYQSKYHELNDSLTNLSKAESIKIREAEYKFKKERSEQEKIFATKTKAQRQFNLFTAIFTAILAVLSFLLFKTARNRKNLADELQQKNEALSALNEAKTRFFANVSHELKTPLSLILNPLQKLKKRKNLPDEDQYLIKTAERKSLELFDLTNQILELTKFEVDKVETQKVDLNLPYLLKKTYAEFESLAHSKKVKLQFDFVGQEDLTIQTDEYKLKTILKNLLSNALKFTEAGGEVQIMTTERADTLEIQVRDNGRGIHAQDLPHVFDRYFQTNRPASISEGGTGIGLAICKEYAKLLGGDIRVQSEYGQFSLFTLTIAKVLAEHTITAPILAQSASRQLPASQMIVEDREDLPSILLVEDNLEMQDYMKYTLQNHYQVMVAGHGAEGLDILNNPEHNIQLILSDVMMPIMNGYEFLEKVKDTPRLAAIPVIMLTALSDSKYKLKGLRIGVDDYLTKPVMEEELLARIDNLLANAQEKYQYQASIEADNTNNSKLLVAPHRMDTTTSQIEVMEVIENGAYPDDLDWLAALEEKISEQLENTLLTVDDLAYQTAMSRSAFYRKVKTLTGLTPNQYINQIRFERARQLLETKQYANVKTVAYKVGFKSRKYFSRNFKQRYGKYPSEYVA